MPRCTASQQTHSSWGCWPPNFTHCARYYDTVFRCLRSSHYMLLCWCGTIHHDRTHIFLHSVVEHTWVCAWCQSPVSVLAADSIALPAPSLMTLGAPSTTTIIWIQQPDFLPLRQNSKCCNIREKGRKVAALECRSADYRARLDGDPPTTMRLTRGKKDTLQNISVPLSLEHQWSNHSILQLQP